jgi:hypothetical protein
VAAAGVLQDEDNRFLWLEVSYDVGCDQYFPSMTWRSALSSQTIPLDSAEARGLLPGAKLLGFIEGNSTGRTSARRVYDGPARFNLWRRQDFDQPVDATDDGGKVWEHWCMLRDIRPSSSIGTSVLTAYVSLLSVLGDRFAAAVARGRRDYGHPRQLCEMVCAGLVAEAAALWDTKPVAIPAEFESRLMSAEPVRCVQVCEAMDWKDPPRYYMFQRRIDHWNDADNVRRELELFRKPDGR